MRPMLLLICSIIYGAAGVAFQHLFFRACCRDGILFFSLLIRVMMRKDLKFFSRFPRMLEDLREMCVEERAVIILLDVGNDEFEELDFENGHESLSVMMFETFRRQFW